MERGQEFQLGARPRTYAQDPRLGGQIREHRAEQEMQVFAHRRHARPLHVVTRRLVVEKRLEFIAMHCFPMSA